MKTRLVIFCTHFVFFVEGKFSFEFSQSSCQTLRQDTVFFDKEKINHFPQSYKKTFISSILIHISSIFSYL